MSAKLLVNVIVKGPSGSGKTFLVSKVLGFFPEETYYVLTAMSERALAYDDEPVSHRFIVIAEVAGMRGETLEYLVRSLLSEGEINYVTVTKGPELLSRCAYTEKVRPG
jgi:Flp pilus assembly CpaF family ATPase